MKTILAFGLTLGLAFSASANEMQFLGNDICLKAMSGQIKGLDVDQYITEIEATGMDSDVICGCVGDGMAELDADMSRSLQNEIISQDYALLAFALDQNIAHCMENYTDNNDGELVGTEFDWQVQEGIYDIADYDMCHNALEGGLMMPGFDEVEVNGMIEVKGRSKIQTCQCSATYMKSISDRLEAEMATAQNPSVIYSSTLAGSIMQCLDG